MVHDKLYIANINQSQCYVFNVLQDFRIYKSFCFFQKEVLATLPLDYVLGYKIWILYVSFCSDWNHALSEVPYVYTQQLKKILPYSTVHQVT